MKSNESKIGILLFLISIFLLIITLYNSLSKNILLDSFDEIFTLNIIQYSYLNMIHSAAMDVHPPVYYIILKSAFTFFYFLKIQFNEIVLGKIVSIIPIIILLIFSLTKIKKDLGWLATGIFAMCIVSMPKLMFYGFELRMYSWALLFVTLSFYNAYKITIKSKTKNWILLTIFSLLGFYTHYYAGISSFIIYGLLFVFLLKNRKANKFWTNFKKLISSGLIFILSCLPWIMYLLNSGGLESGFKLPSITFSSIQEYIWFIVSPAHHFQGYSIIAKIGNNLISTPFTYFDLRSNISIIGIVMIILLIILLIYSFLIKRTKHDSFINYGLLVLICTILIGVITSILIEPTFYDRHMFPALGCFYLTFSLLLSKTYSKKQIFLPLFILFLLVSVSCKYSFICSEKQNELTIGQTKEVLNQVSANDMIIVTDDNFIKNYFVATIMGYHLPLKKPNIDEFVSGASNGRGRNNVYFTYLSN
ncbi:MAG: glycosyltransferase family 39 protein [Methanobrevibacter sp.]|nr:glycosyltransferase family 39 protein [Methanobrevibacter sp.]